MEYAVLLLIVSAIAVGVVSALIKTWSLHARTYSLEDRISVIEGTVTREVKIRAAADRWKKPDKDEALAASLLASGPKTRPMNWWENPELKKGAYTP